MAATAGAALLLSACASAGPGAENAASSTAREQGAIIAARECSRCHAIGAVGESPRGAAPPFRNVRIRYNALSFERRMAEIAEGGHDQMPPLRLDKAQIEAVGAYIEGLGAP